MRFFAAFIGFSLVLSLCNAATVQRRTYRNTEEILVPVTIIQDDIKKSAGLKENLNEVQIKNLVPEVIAEDIATAVDEEQKLEAVVAAVQAERRIDEAIVEEEIKEAVQEEQDKEIIQAIEKDNELGATLVEVRPENIEAVKEPAKEAQTQASNNVVLIEDASRASANEVVQQPEGTVRQATQATPTQTSTQQNLIQLFQNSPIGQFLNGSAPTPTFNPVAAATQAFQGLQQFTSNIATQFQNPFAAFGGQQQDPAVNATTTVRPPGPLQQLFGVSNQQGTLQGLINFFQGRPQESAATTNPESQPSREPEILEQASEAVAATDDSANNIADQASSAEANDSFEQSVQPNELIVVNDDASEIENDQAQEVANVPH